MLTEPWVFSSSHRDRHHRLHPKQNLHIAPKLQSGEDSDSILFVKLPRDPLYGIGRETQAGGDTLSQHADGGTIVGRKGACALPGKGALSALTGPIVSSLLRIELGLSSLAGLDPHWDPIESTAYSLLPQRPSPH